jgi:NAD(P)-dependent dehydrogenase (short-subunit alcohol dehydrogenase family)
MVSSSQPSVVITGGSSGIGAACAHAFARAGMTITLAARGSARLREAADGLTADGARVLPVVADVTDEAAMRMLASRALAAFGRIDILVCSAGLGYHGPFEDTTPDILRRLLEVNVVGTLNAARAMHPYLVAQRDGHVIVISSIVARRGVPGYTAYCAAKAAQAGMAEALRTELGGSGIAVTTVFPVSTVTGFRDAMAREFGVRAEGRGPRQSPEVVARAVLRAMRSRRPEVYTLRRARWLVWAGMCAPRLTDRLTRRFARRPQAPADDASHLNAPSV